MTTDSEDRPVVVAGSPRTGTTWIASVLALADGVAWVNEPDNEWPNSYALKAKLPLGRFPSVLPEERAPRPYEVLWERSLSGHRESPRRQQVAWKLDRGERTMQELWRAMCDHASPRVSPRLRLLAWTAAPPSTRVPGRVVMVKTVHAPLALEWIAARFHPRIVVVQRHPLNVLASWVELGWGGSALDTNPRVLERFGRRWSLPELRAGASPLHRIAWEIGLFTSALHGGAEDHPDWIAASHEALCEGTDAGFRDLFSQLGWLWLPRASAFLDETNRPGSGFTTFRVATEQPQSWRGRLTAEQVREVWSVLCRFGSPWVERVARDVE